jgi:hypothetical protein
VLTLCVLTLNNGYTIVGSSCPIDSNNFDPEMGKRIARERAVEDIWVILGYQLRSRLHAQQHMNDTTLGEALTRMTAASLGNTEALRNIDVDVILAHFKNEHSEEGGINNAD